MNIKVLIATHKNYWFHNDSIYSPLFCGQKSDKYLTDSIGTNISNKNKFFCEFTAIYWAWKNLKEDYIGLCHYRRYFGKTKNKKDIFLRNDYEKILLKYDIILPKKVEVKLNFYTKSTVYKQYSNSHYEKDLNIARSVIENLYSEDVKYFDEFMLEKEAYFYSMFVMSKQLLDEYANWIFPILFELEKRIDVSKYDDYQKRVVAFLGEYLFNIWIKKNKLKIYETDIVFLEKISLIDRLKKKLYRLKK